MSLTLRKGDVPAICGENGAGRSTLMEVLSGVEPAGTSDGGILFGGAKKIPTQFLTPTLVTQENLCEVYEDDPVRGSIACAKS